MVVIHLFKLRKSDAQKVEAADRSNVLAVQRREGLEWQKIEVQKVDIDKLEFLIGLGVRN